MSPPRRSMADLFEKQRAMEPEPPVNSGKLASAAGPAASLPDPYTASGDGQLTPREHSDLATCEAALDNLRVAFSAAGKALQVIRDARLYRGTHPTFEDYLADRWDMSRPQAYRLIDAWPLAQRLSPMGDKLNERQIRELLPLAEQHGQDAAVTVYQTVSETDGVRVTAAVLHGAVSILPAGRWDPAEAVQQIRAYLANVDAGADTKLAAPAADPVERFTAEATRLLQSLRRVTVGGAMKAALDADPDTVKKVIADVRAVLDQIEHDVTSSAH